MREEATKDGSWERAFLAEGGAAKARGRSECLTCLGNSKVASMAAVSPRRGVGSVTHEATGQGLVREPREQGEDPGFLHLSDTEAIRGC